ncbi:hypothetical protein [Anabaena sp. UHCC 0204]|uniref:hypothetical protein n=1 Tax=Anabaena sp. UHCC 0204 TaxID=2590009 RepID=UPI00144617FA|nr:hypothetical protein [Anabaena sp. UHCC 0204]MTJ09828.1 hypothetical protein [Anabaena sp. UHCC 0204]
MRKVLVIFSALLIFLSSQLTLPAFAVTNSQQLTTNQIQQLSEINYSLHTLNDLESRGVINNDIVKSQEKYYLQQAETLVNSPLTPTEITNLVDKYNCSSTNPITTSWQRLTGFFNFVNIIWIISTIILIISIGWLMSIYILPILLAIPATFYEFLVYLACLFSIIGGQIFAEGIGEFIALPGCLGLIGALFLTNYLHKESLSAFYEKNQVDIITLHASILFVIWTGVAIIYQSVIIAFLAILALETLLGFSVLVVPLCYYIGFRERKLVPVTTAASFFLLVFYVGVKLSNTDLVYLNIFSPGALFLGAFVYFIGLLILSSKLYRHNDISHYLWLQCLTVISGVLAIFVGSVWQISQLNGIGGTFFFLYLIEKYWELPWNKSSWAWGTLGLGIVLYLSSFVMKQYPQYFLFSV